MHRVLSPQQGFKCYFESGFWRGAERALRYSMKIAIILLSMLPALAGAATSSLQFLPNANVQGAVAMPNGSVAVFGSAAPVSACYTPCPQTAEPLLVILNASGLETRGLSYSALGSGNSTVYGAAVDANLNIWINGVTDSDDFPLVNPLFTAKKPVYRATDFVAKLDSGGKILFATFLEPHLPDFLPNAPTRIALDSAGNAYVTGNTDDPLFPVTGSVFGTGAPFDGWETYTILLKLSADGSRLYYSRLMGGNGSPCSGGRLVCEDFEIYTTASAIAVDASGNLTVAGTTNATNFPITANAYHTGGGAFISRISADGSQLIWSTEIGITKYFGASLGPLNSSTQSIALDAGGNVYVAGHAPFAIATTASALQPTVTPASPTVATGTGFAAKLSSDGSQLLFATNLGGAYGATLWGLALDAGGNVWIAGNTHSPDFPGLPNTTSAGIDFALELSPNGTALQQIFALVPGTVTEPPGFDSNGNLVLPGAAGNILRLNPYTALSAPAIFAITNAAVPRATAGFASGEIATTYGAGLGPAGGLSGVPDGNGLYPTQLGGVTVSFVGGQRATLLYVSPTQINLQVPFSPGNPIPLIVTTPTGALPVTQLWGIDSMGIFGVVNADGSVNTASNPALSGSIVSLYATGLGRPEPSSVNGAISISADSAFQNSMEVDWQGSLYALPVWYAERRPV
jgi:uncharacterized protein (TIGR03437 family)